MVILILRGKAEISYKVYDAGTTKCGWLGYWKHKVPLSHVFMINKDLILIQTSS